MNIAAAIVVLLSHAGFWVGGTEQRIDLAWAVTSGMPAATVEWELSVSGAPLARGKATLPADDGHATIKIAAPAVRAGVDAVWRYRVIADGGREVAKGERVVHLLPDELGRLKALTAGVPLLVIDEPAGLPAVLTGAGAAFERVDSPSAAAASIQRIIVVGENRLRADESAAGVLTALADGGATVIICRQASEPKVLQFDVAPRDTTGYTVEEGHPLLRHLPREAWSSLASGTAVPTLAVPADEPALALIHSPVESAAVSSAPLDAVLISRTTGRGRIVFCQLPLVDAATDARQQRLLLNLIEYGQTRPQPTPPRSQWPASGNPPVKPGANLIPEGDKR